MSLIISRVTKDSILIFSDTKLTYFDGIERKKPEDGVAKLFLLSNEIAIAFAGDYYFAGKTFKKFNSTIDIKNLCEELLKANLESSHTTEFIVCDSASNLIYSIKNGQIENNSSAWIGSIDGFSKFQEEYHNPKPEERHTFMSARQMPQSVSKETQEEFSNMLRAFNKVINDETIKEVGGFTIPIAKSDKKLEFMTYGDVFRKPLEDLQLTVNSTIGFTSPQEGGYVINFCGGNMNSICFYFLFGQFGVIYEKSNNGTFDPTIIKMNSSDFYNYITNEKKIELGVSMQ